MTRSRTPNPLDQLADDILASRTLGEIAVASELLPKFRNHRGPERFTLARGSFRAMLTGSMAPTRSVVPMLNPISTPLLDLVTVITDVVGAVTPFEVDTVTNSAAEVATGQAKPESTLTIISGEATTMPVIAHQVPILRAHLMHNPALQAMIDTFLTNGLLAEVEQAIVSELIADTGVEDFPFDSDLTTTLRTAVAAAQSAQPELGGGEVSLVLSPGDHAALDLEGLNLREWPCRIVSSPEVADGTAFAGRLRQAVHVSTSEVIVAAGYVNTQLIENRATLLGEVEALPVVVAPGLVFQIDTNGGS